MVYGVLYTSLFGVFRKLYYSGYGISLCVLVCYYNNHYNGVLTMADSPVVHNKADLTRWIMNYM